MISRTTISIYLVEMDTTGKSYGLHEPVCFIRHGGYCSSLGTLIATRYLEGDAGVQLWIPDHTINQIYQWAIAHGWPKE